MAISGVVLELPRVGLLLPLLSDNEANVFWSTPDGDETIVAAELFGSPFPAIGEDGCDAAPGVIAKVLGLRTSANGPPGVGVTKEAGVCQLERRDLLPLPLF